MPKFGSQIDAQRIPLKGLVPEQVTAFPGSPVEGQVVHRTDLKQVFAFLNNGWVRLDVTVNAVGDVPGLQAALDAKMSSTARLNQILAPNSAVDLNNQRLMNVPNPTVATDAANKQYVDMAVQGLDAKQSVAVMATSQTTLSGIPLMDGYQINQGDRVLLNGQSTKSENGIWLAASGAWTRPADFNSSANVTAGAYVFVENGDQNGDTGWVLATTGTINLGSTFLDFVQFSKAGALVAGNGMTQSGDTFHVNGTANRISVSNDAIDIASTYAGQTSITTLGNIVAGQWNGSTIGLTRGGTGATTASGARANLGAAGTFQYTFATNFSAGAWFNITHSLGVNYPQVQLYDVTGEMVIVDVKIVDINTVAIRCDVSIANGAVVRVVA